MNNFVQKLKKLKWWQWLLLGLGIFLIIGWIVGANFGRTKYGKFSIIDTPNNPTQVSNWRLPSGNELIHSNDMDYIGSSRSKLLVFDPKVHKFSQIENFNINSNAEAVFIDSNLIQVDGNGVHTFNIQTHESRRIPLPQQGYTDEFGDRHEPSTRWSDDDEYYQESDTGEEIKINEDVVIGTNPTIATLPNNKILISSHNGLRQGSWQINTYIFDLKDEKFTKINNIDKFPTGDLSVDNFEIDDYKKLFAYGKRILLFDGNKMKITREWELEETVSSGKSTLPGKGVQFQKISNNLVWVSAKVNQGDAIGGYVLNFKTGSETYRSIPSVDLIQGSFDYRRTSVSSPTGDQIIRDGIERDDGSDVDFREVDEDRHKTFFLSFTDKNNILLTGYDSRNIPWSFGVYNIKNNQKIVASNSNSINTDPTTNYWDNYKSGSVQHSITLSNGDVLFVGPLWFVYDSPTPNIFVRTVSWLFHSIEHPVTKAYLVWFEMFRIVLLGIFLYLLKQGKFKRFRLTKTTGQV